MGYNFHENNVKWMSLFFLTHIAFCCFHLKLQNMTKSHQNQRWFYLAKLLYHHSLLPCWTKLAFALLPKWKYSQSSLRLVNSKRINGFVVIRSKRSFSFFLFLFWFGRRNWRHENKKINGGVAFIILLFLPRRRTVL